MDPMLVLGPLLAVVVLVLLVIHTRRPRNGHDAGGWTGGNHGGDGCDSGDGGGCDGGGGGD